MLQGVDRPRLILRGRLSVSYFKVFSVINTSIHRKRTALFKNEGKSTRQEQIMLSATFCTMLLFVEDVLLSVRFIKLSAVHLEAYWGYLLMNILSKSWQHLFFVGKFMNEHVRTYLMDAPVDSTFPTSIYNKIHLLHCFITSLFQPVHQLRSW